MGQVEQNMSWSLDNCWAQIKQENKNKRETTKIIILYDKI